MTKWSLVHVKWGPLTSSEHLSLVFFFFSPQWPAGLAKHCDYGSLCRQYLDLWTSQTAAMFVFLSFSFQFTIRESPSHETYLFYFYSNLILYSCTSVMPGVHTMFH